MKQRCASLHFAADRWNQLLHPASPLRAQMRTDAAGTFLVWLLNTTMRKDKLAVSVET
jgi:hypothetical protein